MIYMTTPGQYSMDNSNDGSSVQQWQNAGTSMQARTALRSQYPDSRIVEMHYTVRGDPSKAYVSDGQGNISTVTFNSNHQPNSMQHGCH